MLCFENCDAISIKREHIKYVLIDGIERRVIGNSDYIAVSESADTVVMQISKDANVKHSQFDIDDYPTMVFDRIMLNDITQIHFNEFQEDEDLTSANQYHIFYVDYSDEENYYDPNKYQKTKVDEDGDLYLVIHKDKDIADFFEGCEK